MSHRYSWHTLPKQLGVKNALAEPFLAGNTSSCKVCHENTAKWKKNGSPKNKPILQPWVFSMFTKYKEELGTCFLTVCLVGNLFFDSVPI